MKKLYRSDGNRLIAGVAGGVADYYDVDPVIIRLLAIFITIITGVVPMALVYLLAAIAVPKQ